MSTFQKYNPFGVKKTPKELAKEAKRETKKEVRVSDERNKISEMGCSIWSNEWELRF